MSRIPLVGIFLGCEVVRIGTKGELNCGKNMRLTIHLLRVETGHDGMSSRTERRWNWPRYMPRLETTHNRVSSCMGRAWNQSHTSLVETDHGRVSLRTRRSWNESGCRLEIAYVSLGNNETNITHWQHERPSSVHSDSTSLVAAGHTGKVLLCQMG
jgi:hypothetical protein